MIRWEHRCLQLQDINRRVLTDPQQFILQEHERYDRQMQRLFEYVRQRVQDRLLVLLSGPSSSGKTTTANRLCRDLANAGICAHVISLDDFYRGRERAPLLPDGTYDYESVEALNLPLLRRCIKELLETGETLLPRFDFATGLPTGTWHPMQIGHGAVVIFEGIHALNPQLEEGLGNAVPLKVFVHTENRIYDGEQTLLSRRDLRLCRRILRDARFRSSQIDNTFYMWPQVLRGEDLYLFPFADTADVKLDTTFAFEPCMTAPLILPQLAGVARQYPQYSERLQRALQPFEALDASLLPSDALLREFFG